MPVGVRDALEANIQDLYINKFWGMKYATVAACTVLKVDQVSLPLCVLCCVVALVDYCLYVVIFAASAF